MAETSNSAIVIYGEHVKWLVGLSTTAVAGGFLHLREIEEQTFQLRLLMAVALILFLVSIWGGTNYLLWLNAVGADKERIKESSDELLRSVTEEKEIEIQKKINERKARIGRAEKAMPSWHKLYTFTFAGALAFSTLFISLALLVYQAPTSATHSEQNPSSSKSEVQIAPTSRYHLVYSAVHQTGHGKEAHTFLLDDQTGIMWQMMCVGKNEVTFKQVQRIGEITAPH